MVEDKGISMSFIHCSQYQCTLLQIETFIQDITVSVKWKTVVTIYEIDGSYNCFQLNH